MTVADRCLASSELRADRTPQAEPGRLHPLYGRGPRSYDE
jgi:hypothetical protein